MRLHIFNPDNDLALATGLLNYTAPAAAQRLRFAGASLPLWHAQSGETVWVPNIERKWAEEIRRKFGLEIDLCDTLEGKAITECSPWGWSASIWNELQRIGVPTAAMPTLPQIEKLRMLSHRRTASQLSEWLAKVLPHIPFTPAAIEVFTVADLEKALADMGPALLKQPWSSSGRGISNTTMVSREVILKWAADSLRLQGSVMVEPLHEVACDFAAIWKCSSGNCRFDGLSVFNTDANGNYQGNLLANEAARKEIVDKHYPVSRLETVLECMKRWIEAEIAPYYNGILGVDMLVTKSGVLDAVVEINLRQTMGWVANEFFRRFMLPESRGYFSATRLKGITAATKDTSIIENGKLTGGSLPLAPASPYFEFIASIEP